MVRTSPAPCGASNLPTFYHRRVVASSDAEGTVLRCHFDGPRGSALHPKLPAGKAREPLTMGFTLWFRSF